jgi:hypothetical protein
MARHLVPDPVRNQGSGRVVRPTGPFHPGRDEYGARTRIEWFELLDVIEVFTSTRSTWDNDVRYSIPSMALVEQYADWTRQYCDGLLHGDFAMLGELRQRLGIRAQTTHQFPR